MTEKNGKTDAEPLKKCFVIMPISDVPDYPPGHFNRVFNHIIVPACKQVGYKAIRADVTSKTNVIIADILKHAVSCDMAICDLSSRNIISGNVKVNSNAFLVPSVVIKSLMDVYNKHNYPLVIKICDSIANDLHSYYKDIHREISYWACLALCRMAKNNQRSCERFWSEVKNIDGADADFLKGFFFRNQGDYEQAEKYYLKTLKKSKMQKAKRELVTVLLCRNRFDDAFSMARENYENDPDNTYHIHAYFRCLVKKHNLGRDDIKVISELMDAVQNSYSLKKEELYVAMEIEYKAYVKKMNVVKMLQFISESIKAYPDSMDIKRAANEYKLRQGIITKDTFEKEQRNMLIN